MTASSPFLLDLRKAILRDFDDELLLACRIGVLQAAGYRRPEIARRLQLPPTSAAWRVACARIDRVAERLDHGD